MVLTLGDYFLQARPEKEARVDDLGDEAPLTGYQFGMERP